MFVGEKKKTENPNESKVVIFENLKHSIDNNFLNQRKCPESIRYLQCLIQLYSNNDQSRCFGGTEMVVKSSGADVAKYTVNPARSLKPSDVAKLVVCQKDSLQL